MPRIATLDNQVSLDRAPDIQRQTFRDTSGESIAQGLGNAAQVIQQVRDEEQLKADRAAFMDADRNTDTVQNDIITGQQKRQLKDAIGSGPEGLQAFDKRVAEIEGSLKTDRQKRAYRESINNRRASLQRQLDNYEGNERERYYAKSREDYKDQAHVNAVTAYRDPKTIEGEIDKIRAVIDQTPGLDADMRKTELASRRSAVYAGVVDRYLANNVVNGAEQYYRSIREKVNGDVATQIEARINAAKERERNQRDSSLALAKAELQDEVRNIEAAARLRLPVQAVPSEARFVALYGERGKKMHQQVQSMANLSLDAAKLDGMSTKDIVNLASGYVPKAAGGDTAAEAERASIIAGQAKAVLWARNEDPVGYLQEYSPVVQSTAAAFEADPNDTTRAAYMNALRGERQRLGIPGDQILSKSQIQGVVERASNFSDTNSLMNSVRAEAARWGKDWPQVFMQAGEKMPDVAYYIGSGISDKASNVVAVTAGLSEQELAKRLPSNRKMADVRNDVADDLQDFSASFPIEGTAALTKMLKGTENLVIGYLSQGASYSEARKMAAKEINDKYTYQTFRDSTYRIPADPSINPEDVWLGSKLTLDRISVPASVVRPGVTSAQVEEVLKESGYWVTNADETGLALYWGQAPTGIEYSWAQLTAASNLEVPNLSTEALRSIK